jgi:uncharacterized protein YegP (UPF0339 family)
MSPCTIEIYRDAAGEHRWRFVASNGKIMADSSEGYRRKVDCRDAIEIVFGSPVTITEAPPPAAA